MIWNDAFETENNKMNEINNYLFNKYMRTNSNNKTLKNIIIESNCMK